MKSPGGDIPFDIAEVGSGAAAMAAAIHARQRNANVLLVERGILGGTCVNVGCVPSKTLLAAAGARRAGVDYLTSTTGLSQLPESLIVCRRRQRRVLCPGRYLLWHLPWEPVVAAPWVSLSRRSPTGSRKTHGQ